MNEGITQQEIERLLKRFEGYLQGEVSLTTYSDGSMLLHRECVDMNESDDLMAFEDTLCSPDDAAEVGLTALYAYLIVNQSIDDMKVELIDRGGGESEPSIEEEERNVFLRNTRGNLFVAKEALYLVIRKFLMEKGVEFLAAYEKTDQSNPEID